MKSVKKFCSTMGCDAYAVEGKRKCEQHLRQSYREADQKRNESANRKYAVQVYGNRLWEQVRANQLTKQPMCEDCLKAGLLVYANTVDHIVGLADGGEPYDPTNLRSLCGPCNSRKGLKDYRNKQK